MNFDKLYQILKEQPKYRVVQVKEAVFQKLIEDWSQATNLPASLKAELKENCPLTIDGQILLG